MPVAPLDIRRDIFKNIIRSLTLRACACSARPEDTTVMLEGDGKESRGSGARQRAMNRLGQFNARFDGPFARMGGGNDQRTRRSKGVKPAPPNGPVVHL